MMDDNADLYFATCLSDSMSSSMRACGAGLGEGFELRGRVGKQRDGDPPMSMFQQKATATATGGKGGGKSIGGWCGILFTKCGRHLMEM